MAEVVTAEEGMAFDGRTAEAGPLGGAETAFVALAEALAARGHRVAARSRCAAPLTHKGVGWAPLAAGVPQSCDLYIGNRGYKVMGLVPRARRRLFWLHNPARYLKKPRNLWRLAWYRPTLVLCGPYHASSVPPWLPCGGRVIFPSGILGQFPETAPPEPPAPAPGLTPHPVRGLDWRLGLWGGRIAPAGPAAP